MAAGKLGLLGRMRRHTTVRGHGLPYYSPTSHHPPATSHSLPNIGSPFWPNVGTMVLCGSALWHLELHEYLVINRPDLGACKIPYSMNDNTTTVRSTRPKKPVSLKPFFFSMPFPKTWNGSKGSKDGGRRRGPAQRISDGNFMHDPIRGTSDKVYVCGSGDDRLIVSLLYLLDIQRTQSPQATPPVIHSSSACHPTSPGHKISMLVRRRLGRQGEP